MTKLSPILIAIAAATAVGIWVFAPLVMLSLPLHLAVRISLRRELRKNGIRRFIPRACIAEIAEALLRLHAGLAETLNWSLLLVSDRISIEIERDAGAIRDWIHGASAADLPEHLSAVLKKYGVSFGSLAIGKPRPSRQIGPSMRLSNRP